MSATRGTATTANFKALLPHRGASLAHLFNYHSPGNQGKSAPAGELGARVAYAGPMTSWGGKGGAWSGRTKHRTVRARLGVAQPLAASPSFSKGLAPWHAPEEPSSPPLLAHALHTPGKLLTPLEAPFTSTEPLFSRREGALAPPLPGGARELPVAETPASCNVHEPRSNRAFDSEQLPPFARWRCLDCS